MKFLHYFTLNGKLIYIELNDKNEAPFFNSNGIYGYTYEKFGYKYGDHLLYDEIWIDVEQFQSMTHHTVYNNTEHIVMEYLRKLKIKKLI